MNRLRRVPNRRDLLDLLPKHGTVVEVGVLRATFSRTMWNKLNPDRMVLIDVWEDYPAPEGPDWTGDELYQSALEFADGKNVELWKGKSVDMIPKLPDRGVRTAYVDADHSYDSVLADLEALLPKMEHGGWLAGHDYCSLALFGVVRAVAVFCDRHNLSVGILTKDAGVAVKCMPPHVKEVNLLSFAIQIP